MPVELLDLPRQAVEAQGEHRLEPLLLIGCEQGCERGFDDIGSRHAPAARPFVELAAKRGIEAEGPFDRGPFHRSIPSPGSSDAIRSEEHTSELQSLMRISYAVFCLKKKKKQE